MASGFIFLEKICTADMLSFKPLPPKNVRLPRYRLPFVDKTPLMRASVRVASSSALANALNAASIT